MSGRAIAYWIATVFVACVMAVSGGLALGRARVFVEGLADLGYPPYFADLLGVGKLAGVVVLLAPGLGRCKEWAYAAFGVVVVSSAYSHFQSGDGPLRAAESLVVAGSALLISYVLRPTDRRPAAGRGCRSEVEDERRGRLAGQSNRQ
jgi:hypothetical protein